MDRHGILRDRKRMTEVSIIHLALSMGWKSFTASDIAQAMDMSIQGALNYLDAMVSEGWLSRNGREYHLTPGGIDMYSRILGEIRAFLDEGFSILGTGNVYAFPEVEVAIGDSVRLYMSEGIVKASKASSVGAKGVVKRILASGIVEVGDIDGIIHIPEGELTVVSLGDDGKDADTLQSGLYGAYDTLSYGYLIARRGRVDFIFAPAEACADAAMKGERAILFVEWKNLPYAISDIASYMRRTGRDLNYSIEKVRMR